MRGRGARGCALWRRLWMILGCPQLARAFFTACGRAFSVAVMENGGRFSELLAQERGRGIDDLAGFDRQAALDAGIDEATVNAWASVDRAYYGPTRYKKLQRTAIDVARAARVPLGRLALIERLVGGVEDETVRWNLRMELLEVKGRCAALRRRAKEIVPPKPPKPPVAGVRCTRTRQGYRQLLVTAPERVVTDVEHAIRRDLDPDRPEAPQMLDNLVQILRGDGGVAEAVPRPVVAVPLPAHMKIISGDGDDVTLQASDGTTMTGAEYLARHNAADLEVALFHPQEGPVNLYRGARFANDKQRTLVAAATPECAWVNCHRPAAFSEVHHIVPWKHGGQTNLSNLAPLCRYHNRVNNDDGHLAPGGRNERGGRRGRIERIRGRPTWVSPFGYTVAKPVGAMHLLFGST